MVTLRSGAEATVHVVLRQGGWIEGRVLEEDRTPVRGARVELAATHGALELRRLRRRRRHLHVRLGAATRSCSRCRAPSRPATWSRASPSPSPIGTAPAWRSSCPACARPSTSTSPTIVASPSIASRCAPSRSTSGDARRRTLFTDGGGDCELPRRRRARRSASRWCGRARRRWCRRWTSAPAEARAHHERGPRGARPGDRARRPRSRRRRRPHALHAPRARATPAPTPRAPSR